MFTLDIGIEVQPSTDINDVFKICDEIEKVLEKERDSSGCGFGVRDMQFEFDTESKAEAAEVKVREIFTKHNIIISETSDSYIGVYNNEENE